MAFYKITVHCFKTDKSYWKWNFNKAKKCEKSPAGNPESIYKILYVVFSFRVVFNFKRHLLLLKVYKVERNFCVAILFFFLQI